MKELFVWYVPWIQTFRTFLTAECSLLFRSNVIPLASSSWTVLKPWASDLNTYCTQSESEEVHRYKGPSHYWDLFFLRSKYRLFKRNRKHVFQENKWTLQHVSVFKGKRLLIFEWDYHWIYCFTTWKMQNITGNFSKKIRVYTNKYCEWTRTKTQMASRQDNKT